MKQNVELSTLVDSQNYVKLVAPQILENIDRLAKQLCEGSLITGLSFDVKMPYESAVEIIAHVASKAEFTMCEELQNKSSLVDSETREAILENMDCDYLELCYVPVNSVQQTKKVA